MTTYNSNDNNNWLRWMWSWLLWMGKVMLMSQNEFINGEMVWTGSFLIELVIDCSEYRLSIGFVISRVSCIMCSTFSLNKWIIKTSHQEYPIHSSCQDWLPHHSWTDPNWAELPVTPSDVMWCDMTTDYIDSRMNTNNLILQHFLQSVCLSIFRQCL